MRRAVDAMGEARDVRQVLAVRQSAKKFLDNVKSNTFVPMAPKDYDIIRKLKKAKDERKKSSG